MGLEIDPVMKRVLLSVGAALLAISLNSCLKANKPPSKVVDINKGNERIYGDPDGPPRQSLQTYDKLPDEIQRADKVRKMLYPS